jgi:hypothetical protein
MKIDLTTVLPCCLDDAVAHVMSTRLLQYVAHPLVSFSPVTDTSFPETWTEGTHWVRLRLFGFLPVGRQAIVISKASLPRGFAIRDAGHSALIPVWDHLITIEPTQGGVRYRDQVEISARVLTPLIWMFAQLFYRHRQRRWRQLAANGFDYGEPSG